MKSGYRILENGVLKGGRVQAEELTERERQDTIQQLIRAMEETGMPSEYVFATKKTGFIVLEDNIHTFTSAQLDEWNEAVKEGQRIARRQRRCRTHLG